MYGSRREIQEGAADLGATLEYNGEEGSGCADTETHINGHSEGNPDFLPGYVCLYLLQARLLHCLLHWGLLTATILLLPWLLPSNLMCHPVVEPPY